MSSIEEIKNRVKIEEKLKSLVQHETELTNAVNQVISIMQNVRKIQEENLSDNDIQILSKGIYNNGLNNLSNKLNEFSNI